MIDISPTIVDTMGATPAPHIFEGHSLQPFLQQTEAAPIRDVAISEYDYSEDLARRRLGRAPSACRIWMLTDKCWKFAFFPEDPPMLFDRKEDPHELSDLGRDPEHKGRITRLETRLMQWALNTNANICMPEDVYTQLDDRLNAYDHWALSGWPIGYWCEEELEAERRKQVAFLGLGPTKGLVT